MAANSFITFKWYIAWILWRQETRYCFFLQVDLLWTSRHICIVISASLVCVLLLNAKVGVRDLQKTRSRSCSFIMFSCSKKQISYVDIFHENKKTVLQETVGQIKSIWPYHSNDSAVNRFAFSCLPTSQFVLAAEQTDMQPTWLMNLSVWRDRH